MIEIANLSFTYPGTTKPALDSINLQIPDGEFCLVMGPSGAGKSTLLRCINGLVPHFSGGILQGKIRVNGLDPVRLSPREMSRTVGFVFQDPEAQFVVDRVEDEIAFSLENIALPREEIDQRIGEVLELLEMELLRTRKLETLSGGERQRVAIAAALALKPKILVLDEPTSQLDPHGAEEVLDALVALNQKLGLTVVLTEHRLERVLPYAGQIIYLSDKFPGGLSGKPGEVLPKAELNPPLIVLGKLLNWSPLPLTIEAAKKCAKETERSFHAGVSQAKAGVLPPVAKKLAFIQARGVKVNYGMLQALRGIDLAIYPGEIAVIMGPNGAGKSTLLRAMIGLVPIQSGEIFVGGEYIAGKPVADICQQMGYLPQDPNALLFADTVMDELNITLKNHHLNASDSGIQPGHLLDQLGLHDKASSYPRDLSTGERQRVAIGAVLVTHPGALLLDEPTRGLDYGAKQTLAALLQGWKKEGMAIVLITHDVELAVQVADRVVLMESGLITAEGLPEKVLVESKTFIPQVAKIFPGRGWIKVSDVVEEVNASQH